jgi:hypothetical protein
MSTQLSRLAPAIKATVAVTGLALVLALPASAGIRLNTTGGTSCKASSGFGASVFYFSNQSAEITSASGQYLTCIIPTVQATAITTPVSVELVVNNPTDVAGAVTCALQTGYEVGSNVSDVVTAIYNFPITANGYGFLAATASSTPAIPAPNAQYDPYTLTCLIPAGAKLGAITIAMPGSLVPDA